MDNTSESDTYLNKIKGLDGLFHKSWSLLIKTFKKLFIKAKQYRRSYYADETTTAFRLFNQDGDGFGGFTVDLYGEFVVFLGTIPSYFRLRKPF